MKIRHFLLAGAVVVMGASSAYAGPASKKDQGGFFPDDYASSPLADGSKSGRNRKKQKYDPRLDPIMKFSEKSEREKRDDGFFSDPTPAPQEKERGAGQRSAFDVGQPLAVNSVGGILNGLDTNHLNSSMMELLDVAERYDLQIGQIYVTGDLRTVTQVASLMPIVARGGTLKMVSAPPKKYEVKKSPAWIVDTDKGEVVLEAVGRLDKNFNSRGNYIDREEQSALGAREPSVEGADDETDASDSSESDVAEAPAAVAH